MKNRTLFFGDPAGQEVEALGELEDSCPSPVGTQVLQAMCGHMARTSVFQMVLKSGLFLCKILHFAIINDLQRSAPQPPDESCVLVT